MRRVHGLELPPVHDQSHEPAGRVTRLLLSLQRTLRIPEDGRAYPLPPGLGRLPLVPGRAPGEVLVPMYQREAVWLAFGGATWRPNAVQATLYVKTRG